MRYIIIGLGIYGANLAIDLTQLGHEVIGADSNGSIVDSLKDEISTTYIIDSTDETSLRMLPLTSVDVVIVAIGENFGASVRTVALLKKAGVKHIYARAVDRLHQSILEGFRVDRILYPEQRAARDLVMEMGLDARVESLPVNPDRFVAKFPVPPFFEGLRYEEIDFSGRFKLKLIDVIRSTDTTNFLGMSSKRYEPLTIDAETRAEKGDTIVVYGTAKALNSLCKKIRG